MTAQVIDMTTAASVVDHTTWGDRLRRIRLNRHMDQEQFAQALGGIKKPTVGKYELQTETPRAHVLIENTVEMVFGKPAADYLRGNTSTDYELEACTKGAAGAILLRLVS